LLFQRKGALVGTATTANRLHAAELEFADADRRQRKTASWFCIWRDTEPFST